jgi:transcriptional regulator of acetoin/glycerol metabolism
MKLLDESNWNKAEVSRKTGYSRAAIWKFMKKWDISIRPLDKRDLTC